MRRWLPGIGLVFVLAYGALLRLEAYTGHYGTLTHPAWARIATEDVAPLARPVRPRSVNWGRIAEPYAGTDPINYLKFAREMGSFYQPHIREPVFLAVTRGGLAALDGQAAAVSLASAIGSLLMIVSAYLLGAAVISPLAGLAAAIVMALDYDLISSAPDGWRDDVFAATVTFAAWAFVRFHQRPVFRHAVLVGITSGLACLTRVTALSFVLPALVWVTLAGGERPRRPRLEYAGVAAVIFVAVLAPFLISCAIATGDPLYAINYHTTYYRAAEGMSFAKPMSTGAYLHAKFAGHPIATLDTAITGEFVWPFEAKWSGLRPWSPLLADLLRWTALAGLLALPFTQAGRLLLVILLGSLVPYAFTWNVGGGGEWRFTMHAYPLYVVAAMTAVAGVWRGVRYLRNLPPAWRARVAVTAAYAAAVCVVAGGAAFVYSILPWYVVREAIAGGESVSVEAGHRDRTFYRDGWSGPHTEGLATVRVSLDARAVVNFPLPDRKSRTLVLRVDPVAPDARQSLTVLFNSQVVLRTPLDWNPQRVGSYSVRLPSEWTRTGTNQLVLIAEPMVAPDAAGPRYAWVGPAERFGVRLWYVRLVPVSGG